jgi:arylsulfatase A-like enzyme
LTGRPILPAAAVLLLLANSCAGPPEPGRTFLLLTIDTLRADHLGGYGFPDGTSPALDRLAASAVVFTDCVSVSSWTMPAMGTLGTGLPPSEHGMIYWHLPLAGVPETLSEVLDGAGIQTAFFGNPIPRLPGLERGFGTWSTYEGDDAAAVDASIRWLARTGGGRFLWVHLLTPHAPYDPVPQTVRARAGLDPREIAYDAEIRTVDLQVQRLLREVGDDAAVLVTADHGETLAEREELTFDHGKYLFEELLRVPCLLDVPGGGPRIERTAVTLADVAPTVCDWFGEEPPVGSYGTSLLPAASAAAGRAAPEPPALAFVVEDEPPANRDRRWAVRGERWKAVFNVDRDHWELYDLELDPGEESDVAGAHPDILERSAAALGDWRQEHAMPRIPFERRFSPAELERLRSLGYLGGADAD